MNKILVIGDLIIDRYIEGETTRISPEAPVPVVNKTKEYFRLGGAGNVAANLQSLQTDFAFVSVVGKNKYMNLIEDVLFKSHLCIHHLESFSMNNTIKTRIISNGQQLVRIDEDNTESYTDSTTFWETINFYIDSGQFGFVVICDYNKGLLDNYQDVRIFINKCKDLGIKVLVDTKRPDATVFAGAYLVTPNKTESINIKGLDLDYMDNVLVTDGSNGMVLNGQHIPGHKVNCVDVCGAGDTVIATIAAELQKGNTLYEACRIANLAASLVVQKQGTSTVFKEELELEIQRGALKVTTFENALKQIKQWRSEGHPINFTNGCFDLLHSGHIELLRGTKLAYTKSRPPKVIVAVDSDRSVEKLKRKPISLNRLQAVASVPNTDLVFEFETEDLENIIKEIKPDVLVKGSDYRHQKLVGEDYAGRVHFINRTDISTSEILSV